MKSANSGNVLGLVELVDSSGLSDTYGPHSYKLLTDTFVNRLKDWTREKDRWHLLDNNRFCVVLDSFNSRGQIELAAAKLRRVFDEPCYIHDKPVRLDINVGFASIAASAQDTDLAVRQAGIALQKARKSSRLFEVYGPHCEVSRVDPRKLLYELGKAVELGEFELYYQPKVHAGYRNLVGAEALIRWHTERGEVRLPDEFIPVAEQHEIIGPMTWWAIKSTVACLSRWPEHLSLSVNVTPNLLLDDEILAVIKDALEIYDVDATRLTVEVTESVMVDTQEVMLCQLARLRELGVRVSIDDFGTGFSSLAYFRDLPADEIKIDKCFVIPMLESDKDHAIVKAVIDLAHNFSLKVVAEGVETEAIATKLAEMRCDVLQGYVFDAPLPLAEFSKRYRI